GGEARERHEVRRRPFPHVADHLSAAESADASPTGGDVDWTVEGEIKIGALFGRHRFTPGPTSLSVGQAGAICGRLADRCDLPFRVGRRPALGPVAQALCLVPVDECHGSMGWERLDLVVATPCPGAAVVLEPIDRPLGTGALAPSPARRVPEFASAIAAGFDEGGKP